MHLSSAFVTRLCTWATVAHVWQKIHSLALKLTKCYIVQWHKHFIHLVGWGSITAFVTCDYDVVAAWIKN